MVGAVVANSVGTVLGGWHKRFGSAHAEVHALAMAGKAAIEPRYLSHSNRVVTPGKRLHVRMLF